VVRADATKEGPPNRVAPLSRYGTHLSRLFVGQSLPTPLTELLELEAFPRVRLVLRGDVVAPLARLACERDRRSLVTHSYVLASART